MTKSNKPTVNSLFVQAASTFAEALKAQGSGGDVHNVFLRPVNVDNDGSMAKLFGLSSNGIRTAALLNASEIQQNLKQLASFRRTHIPLTVVVEGNAMLYLAAIAQTGCIVFQVETAQELSDFILIAQVISEKALVPVVVLVNGLASEAEPEVPGKKPLRNWFGDPDGRVPDPTPAQTMTMGKMRRRMPGWLQVDHPTFVGAQKNNRDLLFERAAQSEFEQVHIQQVIDETFKAFAEFTSRKYGAYTWLGTDRPKNAIVSSALGTQGVDEILNQKPFSKKKIASVSLRQLYPVPKIEELEKAQMERLLVVETAQDIPSQGWFKKEIQALGISASTFQNAWYINPPAANAWQTILENMFADKQAKNNYWLDIAFGKDHSAYPKHEVLLEQIKRDYPNATDASLVTYATSAEAPKPKTVPAAAKQFAGKGAPYARLNRFFDDVACLYDMPQEQVADPFQAYPIMPTDSALFNKPPTRQQIPQFEPSKANDVETYAKVCPHSALPTSLFTLADLIKAGIAAARSRGETISLLVPLSKVWAKNAAEIAIEKKAKIKFAKEILVPGFEKSLPMAKKDPVATKQEYEQVMMAIGETPIAITERFFVALEKAKPGTGELFSLGIDPTACSGCGLCAESNSDGAMTMVDYSQALDNHQQTAFNRFEALPETSAATIKRLLAEEEFDPYAALQLNKSYYRSFAGNGVNWMYASESNVLRMILAQANFTLQSNYADVAKQISVKTAGLNNAIKKVLSDAMPVTSLDALMDVVTTHSEEKLNMDRIFGEWGEQQAFKAIAKEDLERMLGALEGLKQLKWALKEGLNGQGRNAFSLVIDESLSYAAQYPWNGFNVASLFAETGDSLAVALGAFEGQIRNVLDNVRLLRRADIEATGKYKPEVHNPEIANLSYGQLTEEEMKLVPPLFVLATQQALDAAHGRHLQELLNSGYPIKVILLESGKLSNAQATADLAARTSAIWPAIASQKAFVGRTTLAQPKQLFNILENCLTATGAAIMSVLTPNAFAYNIHPARWASMCNLAESTRFFMPLRFTPGDEKTAAEKMEIGIENIDADWSSTELVYQHGEVEKKEAYSLTPADYLYLLNDWQAHFVAQKAAPTGMQIAEYLKLEADARKTKVPVIMRVDADGNLLHFSVSQTVVEVCETALQNFKLLREWAGLYTAFPAKLKEEVRQEMQGEFDAEKKKMQAELATEKKAWEGEHLDQLKVQVKERLMKMAGQL